MKYFLTKQTETGRGVVSFPWKTVYFKIFDLLSKLINFCQYRNFRENSWRSLLPLTTACNSLISRDIYFCGVRESPPEKAHNSHFSVRCLKLSKMKLGGEVWRDYAYNMAPMAMLSIAPSEVVWPSGNKIFEDISIMSVLCLH